MEETTQRVPTARISAEPQIDERRALIMSMQAILDPEMLRVIAALHSGERHFLDLAAELKIPPRFGHGPFGRLIFLEIVSVREVDGRLLCALNQRRLRDLNGALQRLSRDLFAADKHNPTAESAESLDEQERLILRKYLRGERLAELPSLRNQRHAEVVLRWLASQFEEGRRYHEREVNELLTRHHEDFASLRRYLVDLRLMARAEGYYWRLETPPAE